MSDFDALTKLAIGGRRMSAAEAQKLEQDLQKDPTNVQLRALYLGYCANLPDSREAGSKFIAQVLFICANHAGQDIEWLSTVQSQCFKLKEKSPPAYERVKERLLARQPDGQKQVQALLNASYFFEMNYDFGLCKELVNQAIALEPDNTLLHKRLSDLSAHVKGS